MQTGDFCEFLKENGVDLSSTSFWAPELLKDCFHDPYMCGNAQIEYYIYVRERFISLKKEDLLDAAIVLFVNNGSFKARIEGAINDNWLHKNVFHPIADECVQVLENLPAPTPIQMTLKQKFVEMM